MLNLFANNLFYLYNTDLTDQLEDNINKCAHMSPINNLKNVEIQINSYYPNKEILKNKI